MGIDYQAALIFGLRRGDMNIDDDLNEKIANGDVDSCPPYYDGGGDDGEVVGVLIKSSPVYGATDINVDEISTKVEAAAKRFKELTGLDGKLWLSTNGW
jgi:hypothetical protein